MNKDFYCATLCEPILSRLTRRFKFNGLAWQDCLIIVVHFDSTESSINPRQHGENVQKKVQI